MGQMNNVLGQRGSTIALAYSAATLHHKVKVVLETIKLQG